ncbi:kynureninase [Metaclostridioides mangenotii]|uniref:kynureninase n=1 Tax=Metaclostridioides mangenotii TaxID=1540 RepID=UPI0028EC1F60|nr:kynureninase [Clostridioides mangenotii]
MLDRNFKLGMDYALELDFKDPLKKFRSRFYMLENKIYMDGNSLGLCSKDALDSLNNMVDQWKNHAIGIWNVEDSRYFRYSDVLAELLAPHINASLIEICITGTTTSTIHQTISTLYKPTDKKYKILVDDLNFPTDRYAVDSIVRLKGLEIEDTVKVVKSPDGKFIDENAVIEAMSDDVALILLPAVLYRSSQLLDMKKLTDAAHKKGIIIGWDLCHSIGSVPHDFEDIQPDFAVWCNYKYLSAGPGATAGVYLNKKYFGTVPGLTGWFGNKDETQFLLRHTYEPELNATSLQTGTPNLLSMAPLEGSLKIYKEAGLDNLREKSLHITAYLMYLIDERLVKYGYSYDNPTDDNIRGGHVSLVHDEAYRISFALKAKNIVPDYREPNVIRLAPIALYNTYEEVHTLVDVLESIVATKFYEEFSEERILVY